MSPPKPIGLHVRLTPEQAATLDRLIADGGDPEATRSRIVRELIDGAAKLAHCRAKLKDRWGITLGILAAAEEAEREAVTHSCTNAAPCPRCSS